MLKGEKILWILHWRIALLEAWYKILKMQKAELMIWKIG